MCRGPEFASREVRYFDSFDIAIPATACSVVSFVTIHCDGSTTIRRCESIPVLEESLKRLIHSGSRTII